MNSVGVCPNCNKLASLRILQSIQSVDSPLHETWVCSCSLCGGECNVHAERAPNRKPILSSLDVCPKCHEMVVLRLIERVHPPMHTKFRYTCPKCQGENTVIVQAVGFVSSRSAQAETSAVRVPVD